MMVYNQSRDPCFTFDILPANIHSTGMGGGEGAFIMVTFWLVEAMARVRRSPF